MKHLNRRLARLEQAKQEIRLANERVTVIWPVYEPNVAWFLGIFPFPTESDKSFCVTESSHLC